VTTYSVAGAFLWLASIFRPENRPIFVLVLSIAVLISHRHVINRELMYYLALPAVVAAAVAARAKVPAVLGRLANIRGYRARGRTAYLSQVIPETIPSAIAFSWLGAAYFLFAPFPWMISQLPDFVAFFEGITNLSFAVAGLYGFRLLLYRNATVAISLAVGIVLSAVLYGLANANVGTVVRQRQMIIWALFVFGGVGVAEHFGLSLSSNPAPDGRGKRPTTD
jgi:hypothetical protein